MWEIHNSVVDTCIDVFYLVPKTLGFTSLKLTKIFDMSGDYHPDY